MFAQDPLRIAAEVVFGAIGGAAFIYGWKHRYWRPTFVGLALMGYPYLFANIIVICVLGCGLTAALYFWQE